MSTRGSRKSRAWPIWARSSRACASRASPDSGSASPTWTTTACGASSPGASQAAPWKARSAPTAARKAAGPPRGNRAKPAPRASCGYRRRKEGCGCACSRTARASRPWPPRISPARTRCPCACRRKTAGSSNPRSGTTNNRRGRARPRTGISARYGVRPYSSPLGAQTPDSRWDRGGSITPSPSISREVCATGERSGPCRYNDAMKLLFDLFPVVLFFVAFKLFDIYTATAAAIAATFLQIGWLKWRRRRVDTMMWISLVIIVVFGGATLALHDETFIKWKPTVLYWLFGVVIAVAQSLFRRNLVRAMLGEQVRMPDGVWTRLNWSWVGFFIFMGAANLLVAYNFPTDTWVNFKLFGGMGLMLVFVVLQALFLARHVEEKDASS